MACRAADRSVNTIKAAHLGGGERHVCVLDFRSSRFLERNGGDELVKRGAEMIQADQDTGAHVLECWSRDHGHPRVKDSGNDIHVRAVRVCD
jgi:hypothetical protein